MPNVNHTEDILDTIKSYTAANLQTYLTAITSAEGDGVTLTAPAAAAIVTGPLESEPEIRTTPIGFLYAAEAGYESISSGWDQITVNAELWLLNVSNDKATLLKQIYRYGAGFRNMVRANWTLGDSVGRAKVDRVRYWQEVFGRPDIMAASIDITIEKDVPVE